MKRKQKLHINLEPVKKTAKKLAKNRKLWIGTAVIVAAFLIGFIVATLLNRQALDVTSVNDSTLNIYANNAAGVKGVSSIYIADGHELEVRTSLDDKHSISLALFAPGQSTSDEPVMEATFDTVEIRRYQVPAGSYSVRIIAEGGATGGMTVSTVSQEDIQKAIEKTTNPEANEPEEEAKASEDGAKEE